jgi:hypothetical protein
LSDSVAWRKDAKKKRKILSFFLCVLCASAVRFSKK